MNEMFDRARDETARLVPPFERTWMAAEEAAARGDSGPTSRRWWLSWRMGPWTVLAPATAAAALALIAFVFSARSGDASGLTAAERRMIADLSGWTAPTDFLLEDNGLGVPRGTPDLGSSLGRLKEQLDYDETTSTR